MLRSFVNQLTVNKLSASLLVALVLCHFGSQRLAAAQVLVRPPEQVKKILKGGTIYLFTSPESCPACRHLDKRLRDSGQEEQAVVKYQGEIYSLPIARIDPWTKGTLNADELRALGYQDDGLPQFSMVYQGQVLGTPSAFDLDANAFDQIDKHKLMPLADESIERYESRVTGLVAEVRRNSELEFSQTLLALIGAEDIGEIHANAAFKPNTASHNVLILGTATLPLDNPLFTGMTIEKIQKVIAPLVLSKPIVLYGSGPLPHCDTCQVAPEKNKDSAAMSDQSATAAISENSETANQRQLIKYALTADASPTRANIASFFEAAKESRAEKNLIVLVGHGTKDGFPTWLNLQKLSPNEMGRMTKRSGATNVMVSGNCYGGIMANSVSCGFFAANPRVPASGCWEDAESGKSLKDYTSLFFESLNDESADYDRDGVLTFSEAHAHAIQHSVSHDKPYSTLDALADEFFEKNPQDRIERITSQFLVKLAQSHGSQEEIALAKTLLGNKKGTIQTDNSSGSAQIGPAAADYTYYNDEDKVEFHEVRPVDLETLMILGYDSSQPNSLEVMPSDDGTFGLFGRKWEHDFFEDLDLESAEAKQILDQLRTSSLRQSDPLDFGSFAAGEVVGNLDREDSAGIVFRQIKIKNFADFQALFKIKALPEDAKLESLYISTQEDGSRWVKYQSRSRQEKEKPTGFLVGDLRANLVERDGSLNDPKLKTLARRLIFKSKMSQQQAEELHDQYESVLACERQDFRKYLSGTTAEKTVGQQTW